MNKKSIVPLLASIIMIPGLRCLGQEDYSLKGDQNLVLARSVSDKDSVNTALKDALTNFSREIEINPGSGHAYAGRGEAKFMLGDYRGAITDCRKAAEIDPTGVDANIVQGRAEAALGDYRLALREFDKAIDLNPHHKDVYLTYYYRGKTKSDSGNDAAAIIDYNRSLEIAPYAPAYFHRGFSKINIADRKGACLDWIRAKELGLLQADEMLKKYCR